MGFPGETEQDFADTMNLIHEIGFDNSYSFIYSRRPGTPAAALFDDVPLEIKKKRLQILQDQIIQNTQKISHAMLGTTQRVLVTGYDKKGNHLLASRTENNRIVHFKGGERLIGQLVDVEIMEVKPNSLVGQVLLPVTMD